MGGLDDPSLPAAYRATRMARADFVVESIRAERRPGGRRRGGPLRSGGRPSPLRRGGTRARSGADPGEQRIGLGRRHLCPPGDRSLRSEPERRDGAHHRPGVCRRRPGGRPADRRVRPSPYRTTRPMGPHRRPDLGRGRRFPRRGLLRRRQGGAGQLHPRARPASSPATASPPMSSIPPSPTRVGSTPRPRWRRAQWDGGWPHRRRSPR